MTDLTDDSASAEPVDARVDDDLDLTTGEPDQDEGDGSQEGQEGDDGSDDGLIDWQDEDGSVYRVPAKVRDGLMLKADHTRKTMEVAELRKATEARASALQKTEARQVEFAGEIAQLGALNARLAPFAQVRDWPSYLRQGGAEAQAHWAEYQALTTERDRFAQGLTQKVQQRTADEQRETVELVNAGRAELAKHIKGYDSKTLDELVTFGSGYGFNPDDIRAAEADPKSIRVLHRLMVLERSHQQQQRTSTQAQAAQTAPVKTLRGGGAAARTPAQMSPGEMAKHLGY